MHTSIFLSPRKFHLNVRKPAPQLENCSYFHGKIQLGWFKGYFKSHGRYTNLRRKNIVEKPNQKTTDISYKHFSDLFYYINVEMGINSNPYGSVINIYCLVEIVTAGAKISKSRLKKLGCSTFCRCLSPAARIRVFFFFLFKRNKKFN